MILFKVVIKINTGMQWNLEVHSLCPHSLFIIQNNAYKLLDAAQLLMIFPFSLQTHLTVNCFLIVS